jgi:hypothetical protein
MDVGTIIECLAVIAAAIYGVLLSIVSSAVVVVFRLLAVRFDWRFPPLRSS